MENIGIIILAVGLLVFYGTSLYYCTKYKQLKKKLEGEVGESEIKEA